MTTQQKLDALRPEDIDTETKEVIMESSRRCPAGCSGTLWPVTDKHGSRLDCDVCPNTVWQKSRPKRKRSPILVIIFIIFIL